MEPPILFATSWMMSQSGRDSPTGSSALFNCWSLRSRLVNVPVFSALAAAGSTTSAIIAVSVMKMSCTTRNSSLSSGCLRRGSLPTGSSPP